MGSLVVLFQDRLDYQPFLQHLISHYYSSFKDSEFTKCQILLIVRQTPAGHDEDIIYNLTQANVGNKCLFIASDNFNT